MLTSTMKPKLRTERFSRSKSLMPTDSPMPMIGPISGEMSIAPMMTAVELTFRPKEATNVANISTQRFVPRKSTPRQILSTTSSCRALSSPRSKRSLRKRLSESNGDPEALFLVIIIPWN